MRISCFLLLLAAALAFQGCGGNDVVDSTGTLAMSCPPGWRAVTPPPGLVLMLVGPSVGGSVVSINAEAKPCGPITVDQFTAQEEATFPPETNYRPESRGAVVVGSEMGRAVVYTATYGGPTVKQKQVYVVKDGVGYCLTYSALPQTFDSFLATFDNAVATIRFR